MAANHANYSAAQLDQPPRRQARSEAWFFAHGKFAGQAHVASFWALNFLTGPEANVSDVHFVPIADIASEMKVRWSSPILVGSISVKNVSGDVAISGYDGDVVMIRGFKEGRDREDVEVEDRSSGNRIDVGVRYAPNCNCDASVRFEVRVPRSASYDIDRVSTASGNIDVEGVRGNVNVSTASGDVTVREVNGRIHASTASGVGENSSPAGAFDAR